MTDHKRTNTPHAASTPCDILSIGGPLPPFGYVKGERVWSMWGDEVGALKGLEETMNQAEIQRRQVEQQARSPSQVGTCEATWLPAEAAVRYPT